MVVELCWRAGLDDVEIREVHEVAAAAAAVDGFAPLSEHVLTHLGAGGAEAAHLLARAGTTLIGAAHLELDVRGGHPAAGGSGELTVHPDHRRVGIGTRMVRELIGRVPAGATLQVWAHGAHPAAAALAARLNFRPSRELWQLRRSLSERLADLRLPAGVRIRTFQVGVDEPEFLRVNNAAFAWHPEQGGWGLGEITSREREPWFDPAGFLLAVDESDRLLGFHWTKVHPATDSAEAIGEVYVLGVDPSARGLSLGTALTLAGLHHLRDRGLGAAMLYVEADNAAAVRVYQGLGFSRWHTDIRYSRGPARG